MTASAGALVGTPLSLDQLRLWRALLDCPAQSFRSYGIMKVPGTLTLPRLREAFEQVSRDHDLLRSRLVSIPGMVYPVLMPGKAGSPLYHDLGQLDVDEDRAVDRLEQELASARFSYDESSLVHVCFGRFAGEVLWGLAMPAMLADGPSVEALLTTISRVAADRDASAPGGPLDPPPMPYARICRWRERLIASDEATVGRRLWQEKLSSPGTASRETIIPASRRTPSAAPPEVTRVVARIPGSAATSSSFFAAWYFLLWKLCNGPTAGFHVAAQCDGRSVKDFAGAIGPLERFLPIAVAVDRGQRWRKLADDLARQLDEASEWQDCFAWSDFEDLENSSATMRSFDYGFERLPDVVAGTALAVRRRYSRSERFTLKLDVRCSQGSGLELALYYAPQHISPDHAHALLGAYRHLLEQVAADDTIRLADLTWPDAPRAAAAASATRSAADDVIERFNRIATRYPDRIALSSDEQSLSYAGLHKRADALALTIRNQAPVPESCIAMIGGLSFNTIVGMVAILKAGHYFVHIDPEHPPARTVKVLRECAVKLILHDTALADTPVHMLVDTLGIAATAVSDAEAVSFDGEAPSAGASTPVKHRDQLAYVTYTSGSTGEPNGVMISHASLATQMAWLVEAFGFSREDSWLLKTPLGFDASIWEWMTPLCVGATLVFGGQKLHMDPARIVRSIRDHRVTALQVVPSLLRSLIDEAPAEDLHSLRYVFAGGEPLPPDVCQAINRDWRATLVNLYGPTETTINASSWTVPRPLTSSAEVAIGRPVDGMSACVLDTLGQPLPPNFIGELGLAGSGLARGYAHKPGVTAEKFVPARAGAGQRMYRTGDLASCSEDGTLFYWGRRDSQIKLRGYRVELGEIEAVLSSHGAVKTAAACICTAADNAESAQLIAYIVPRDAASRSDTQVLREYLREHLPEYMVPASIVVLDGLPLTPTGKIDRKLLASHDFLDLYRSASYVAPETSTQATLCEIWRRILDVDVVGIGDHFLELGGQSLLVTRLIGHVRDSFGIEVSPRLIFDFPVLRDFAGQIDHRILRP